MCSSDLGMPHHTMDPVPVACQLVMAYQTIISRNLRPIDAGVVSVSMFHAGEAVNVIPPQVELQGTVRTFSIAVLDAIEQRMRTMAEHITAAAGMTATFSFTRNYPPTINSTEEANFARQVMVDLLGEQKVLTQEPSMGAEDFSFMLEAKPGCYAHLANGDGTHRDVGHGAGPCMLHNASYDFNDDLLPLGASYWVRLAQAWLKRP